MLRALFVVVTCLLFANLEAQSTFDSLKNVYSAQRIFENRSNGSVSQHIKDELNKIEEQSIRQLASCAIAENVYGYGWVKDKELLSMVEDVIEKPANEEVHKVAVNVKTEMTRSLVNTKIQPISLPAVTGDSLVLEDYYSSGKEFVVVDLWATWCGPCISEMKKFNGLRQQYNNIEFYSISLDDDFAKVQRFVSKNKDYTWPIVWAGKNSPLWDYFKARLIPAFVVVNKNGLIISHVLGKGLEAELKKLNKK